MKLLKIFVLLMLCSVADADYLVLKLGSRGLTNGNLTTDWRDGQIVEILPDSEPISDHTKTHFVIVKVKEHFTPEQRFVYLNPVYEIDRDGRQGKMLKRRQYYVDIPTIPTFSKMSASSLSYLYEKKMNIGIIDLTGYKLTDIIKFDSAEPIKTSIYDKGGSVSSGQYTIGAGQDYATIALFEADLAAALTGSVTGQINTALNTTTNVTFAGTVTFSTTPVILTVASAYRHAGKWDDTKARSIVTTYVENFTISESNIYIDGLQMRRCSEGSQSCYQIDNSNSNGNKQNKLTNCLIDGNKNTDVRGSIVYYASGGYNTLENCIIYNGYSTGDEGAAVMFYYDTAIDYIYNCTISSNVIGIKYYAGTKPILKNIISYGNGTDYAGTYNTGSTHNLSKDNTAPATGTYYTGKTLAFTNPAYGTWDFSLVSGDTDAIDMGTTAGTALDIIGTARPQGVAWDIGAFEYVASEVGVAVRSKLLNRSWSFIE